MDLNILKQTKNRFSLINSQEAKIVDEINDALMWGAMLFLRRNFVWIEVPTLTKITGACENINTLYSVDHFGIEAFLAQTGQLYLEAKIPIHNKVWTVIDSSRAEPVADERHLNQFQLIEFEHRGNLEYLLENIEETIKSMLREAVDNVPRQLKTLGRYDEISRWLSEPFGRITYTKAVELLRQSPYAISWGDDLARMQEMYLVSVSGSKPLFITHFPKKIKFFNMRQNDSDENVVNSADLIMPYSGEAVGSAERESDYERLVARLKESQMFRILSQRGKTLDDFTDYLELIKKCPILHSGCGIGFGRVSQSVLGTDDIRISSPYPIQNNILY